MAHARVRVEFDSEPEAGAVEQALLPELGDDVPGSRSALRREGATLLLELRAEDAGALRAALNSYLRWMRTASEVHRLARPRRP